MSWKNLHQALGLPTEVHEPSGRLRIDAPVGKEIQRSLLALAASNVLAAPVDASSSEAQEQTATWIYRHIDDANVLALQGIPEGEETRGLKFDVTSIPPLSEVTAMTPEFPKTIGHFHTRLPGSAYASPDYYQIACGSGLLILQEASTTSTQVYYSVVGAGDVFLIPPWLGHVTVNIGDGPLVFSNVCVRAPHLDYKAFTNLRGAAYYAVSSGTDSEPFRLVENPSYAKSNVSVARPVVVRSNSDVLIALGIDVARPIYNSLVDGADVLDALQCPDNHLESFRAAIVSDISRAQ